MAKEEWDEGVVHIRSTDKDGNASHAEHRCWHRGRFVKALHATASKEGGRVEQITEADYRRAVGKRRR